MVQTSLRDTFQTTWDRFSNLPAHMAFRMKRKTILIMVSGISCIRLIIQSMTQWKKNSWEETNLYQTFQNQNLKIIIGSLDMVKRRPYTNRIRPLSTLRSTISEWTTSQFSRWSRRMAIWKLSWIRNSLRVIRMKSSCT